MKRPKELIRPLSWILLAPALFLCGSGILYLAFRLEGVNDLMNGWTRVPVLKALLSPVIVLGGPIATLLLNLPPICQIRFATENANLQIALTVRRAVRHLSPAAVAGGLLILLFAYAFVENFKIVAR